MSESASSKDILTTARMQVEIEKLKAENAELKFENEKRKSRCEFLEKASTAKFREMIERADAIESNTTLDRCSEASHYTWLDDKITKLTHQRDTLKKCAEFYADKNNWHNINGLHDTSRAIIDEGDWSDIKEPSDYYHIRATGGKTARKALQDVEESENEKA